MGGEAPPRRAAAAPPMGKAGGYRLQQKRPPAWTREPGVQAGREKPGLLPFKPLSNTTRRLQEYILSGSPGKTGI